MTIDRCLCHGRPFAALKRVAETTGAASVPALRDAARGEGLDFGRGCGLCHPYVRRMLRTGEAAFHAVVTEADEPCEASGP